MSKLPTSSSPEVPAEGGAKPRLVLMGGGKTITADDVARMFKALTGKDPIPEELALSQNRLDDAYAK